MCSSNAFDYKQFMELGGLALGEYMDPLLSLERVQVPVSVLLRIRDEMPRYDEVHLVYAIYFGAKQSPENFAHLLPRYLGDRSGSVWTAAFNCLNQLPDELVTRNLVEAVRHVQMTNPGRQWIADALATLEKRLQRRTH